MKETKMSTIETIIALTWVTDDVFIPFDECDCTEEEKIGGIHVHPRWGDVRISDDRTLRLWDDDGEITLVMLTGGAAMIEDGRMRFSHAFADPVFVAATIVRLIDIHGGGVS